MAIFSVAGNIAKFQLFFLAQAKCTAMEKCTLECREKYTMQRKEKYTVRAMEKYE